MIGKHYLVTGGTSGLGLEIVKQLIQHGAYVTILARNVKKFNSILFFKRYQHRISVIECDIRDKENIFNVKTKLDRPLDGIIYSSGLGYFKSFQQHSSDEMLETYEVNVIGFNLLFNELKQSLTKGASIVVICSQAAFVTQMNASHYGASKSALISVVNALRLEEPDYHFMTVNTGPVQTPFHSKADPSLTFANKYKNIMISPQQLAKAIINGMIYHQIEINQPYWMHMLLKLYQIAPRWAEYILKPFFKNKA